MNAKFLLVTAGAVLMTGATAWYVLDGQEETARYTPRIFSQHAQGIEGAFEYNAMIRANIYTGEYEPDNFRALRKAAGKLPRNKSNSVSWISMGPDNIGGRTRTLYSYPDDPDHLISGGVSGGLFRSFDAGNNWEPINSFAENLCVVSIARLGNGTFYVGTGSSHEFGNGTGGSGFLGGGLFKSTDNGETWQLVNDFAPVNFNTGDDWATIDFIQADPVVENKLWVGNAAGLFEYIDGNASLEPKRTGLPAGDLTCEDFKISTTGETIIASIGKRGYLSRNGGESFELLDSNNGFPSSNNGRIEFAIAPSDENYIYASIAGTNSHLKGIYASIDNGQSWTVIAPNDQNGTAFFSPFATGISAQGIYDNCIIVSPNNPRRIFMGGIRVYRHDMLGEPSIGFWEQLNIQFTNGPNPLYVHSDIHELHYTADGSRLYIMTDGGFFLTTNDGNSFANRNFNYITTQLYGISFNQFGQVLGGTQDNGTFFLNLEGSTEKNAVDVLGGDGFDCELSQLKPEVQFATLYYGDLYRSTNNGTSMNPEIGFQSLISQTNDFYTDIRMFERGDNPFAPENTPVTLTPSTQGYVAYNEPVAVDGDTILGEFPAGATVNFVSPTTQLTLFHELDETVFYYGSKQIGDSVYLNLSDTVLVRDYATAQLAVAVPQGVYVTKNPLDEDSTPLYARVADGQGNSSPLDLEWSPDGNHLFVSYSNGALQRISGFNNAWTIDEMDQDSENYQLTVSQIRSGGAPVTDIEVDYSQGQGGPGEGMSEVLYISLGGYGGSQKVQRSNNAYSTTGLASFGSIWNVPAEFTGMPVYSIVVDKSNPDNIVAGTELGIWVSTDGGDTWAESNGGEMARVPVFDLRQQKLPAWNVENSGIIYAGTHGRGIFRSEDYLITSGVGVDDLVAEEDVKDLLVFPNPASSSAFLKFTLNNAAEVGIAIFDMQGRRVMNLPERRIEAGQQQVQFDVSKLPNGAYVVALEGDGFAKVTRMLISR